jgi:hypothetical protein
MIMSSHRIKCFSFCAYILGLHAAAYDLGMEWVIVKGVSDLAGGSNLKKVAGLWGRFASVVAASVVHNVFKYSVVLEDVWPRRRGHKR